MTRRPSAETPLLWLVLLLLGAGIVYPLLGLLSAAVVADGRPAASPFLDLLTRPLLREALVSTLLTGVVVVALGSLIAVPLAVLTARYSFPGRSLLRTLGLFPIVVPPFVGAIGLQHILGPLIEGLRGVILVQALHYFPFILLSVSAALAGLDRSLEEAAQNLGASGVRIARRVLLPLALPAWAAGALVVLIRVLDDLGTPLMLGVPRLLAPQAYLRVATAGPADPDGAVICVALAALSLAALWMSMRLPAAGELGAPGRSGEEAPARRLGARGALAAWIVAVLLLAPALLPLAGLVLLSASGMWGDYDEILFRAPFIWNSVRYALVAAALDVGLGAVIAWLLFRGGTGEPSRGRRWLDTLAAVPAAVPGVALAAGYLLVFHGWRSTSLLLVIVYAVRRLPETVRAAGGALRRLPLSLEEAAQNLGATRRRATVKVILPLVVRALLAGGMLAWVGSAVDVSATLLLVPRPELGPLASGVFDYVQSPAGRGPAAALGVAAIALAAAGACLAARLARRGAGSFGA